MIDCNHCDKEFRNEAALKIHLNKRHDTDSGFECPYCDKEYESYDSLVRHAGRYCEGDGPKKLYEDFCFGGETPKCECGCGEKVNFQKGSDKGYKFAKYKQGHHVRDQDGFYTEEGLRKSAETRRQQFENGERQPWNKGMTYEENPDHSGLQKLHEKNLKENNPERAQKISEALKGREFDEKTIKKFTEHWQEYWSKEKHRKEQRERRLEYMNSSDFGESSELEKIFADILETLGIEYEHQKPFEGFAYDFYLPKTDTYIEVHGDFWHCNEDAGYGNPKYDTQKRTVKNDKMKEKVIEQNDKDLLVFWETNIEKNRQDVAQRLLEHV